MAKHVVICPGNSKTGTLSAVAGLVFTALVVVGIWKVCMTLGRVGMVAATLAMFVGVGALILLLLIGASDHHRAVRVQERATLARQKAARDRQTRALLVGYPTLELEAQSHVRAELPANVIPFQRREREIA